MFQDLLLTDVSFPIRGANPIVEWVSSTHAFMIVLKNLPLVE